MLAIQEAVIVLGGKLRAVGLGLSHGSFRFDVISLQGQGTGSLPLVDSSEIDHQGDHLIGIDGRIVPCHAVTRSTQEATDHAFHHATLELIPGGLIIAAVGHTCLGGVVEKLIVANPEGSVPGLVICVTVHRSGRLVDVISLQGQMGDLCPPCASSDAEHQISDGVGVGIGAAPLDRVTVRGAHPDHALLTPCLAQAVGVVDIGRPVASPLIEGLPGGGLNGEGHQVVCFVPCIVDPSGDLATT